MVVGRDLCCESRGSDVCTVTLIPLGLGMYDMSLLSRGNMFRAINDTYVSIGLTFRSLILLDPGKCQG